MLWIARWRSFLANAGRSRCQSGLTFSSRCLRASLPGRLARCLIACFLGCIAVSAQGLRVDIEVFPESSLGPVSPYVFGAGIDHKTNPMRFCRYPEQVARDIAESNLRIARYPGGFVFARDDHRGSWKNFYWQDHIGQNPESKPLYTYDLDTFVQMCERFGIEPLMQINFVGESEESVRGYIEYLVGDGDIDGDGINWAAKRAENGRKKPYRIRDWGVAPQVQRYRVGAPSYLAENSMADPDRVTLSGPETVTRNDGRAARFRLEPNTLMVLRFQRLGP